MRPRFDSAWIGLLWGLLWIALCLPGNLMAQKYALRLIDVDSAVSGVDAWGVYDVQDTNTERLIGHFPLFFDTYGYIHDPVVVGKRVFFGFVNSARMRSGKAWDTMVWGVYGQEGDSIRLLEHVIQRIRHRYPNCNFEIEDEQGCLIYERGHNLECIVRFGLRSYELGAFEKWYRYFRHQFRNYRKLKEAPLFLYLDQI